MGFLAVRMLGLVLIVPLFEELFWRSFVVRWIIDPDDFRKVPIGRVTLAAGAITAACSPSSTPPSGSRRS